jgi:hypothetical protein
MIGSVSRCDPYQRPGTICGVHEAPATVKPKAVFEYIGTRRIKAPSLSRPRVGGSGADASISEQQTRMFGCRGGGAFLGQNAKRGVEMVARDGDVFRLRERRRSNIGTRPPGRGVNGGNRVLAPDGIFVSRSNVAPTVSNRSRVGLMPLRCFRNSITADPVDLRDRTVCVSKECAIAVLLRSAVRGS